MIDPVGVIILHIFLSGGGAVVAASCATAGEVANKTMKIKPLRMVDSPKQAANLSYDEAKINPRSSSRSDDLCVYDAMEGYLGNTERWKGVAGALLVQGALLWLLIAGLAIGQSPVLREKLDLFAMAKDQPPPPPPAPQPKHNSAREGAASPANLRSTATDLVAPQPVLPPPPQPIAAAPVANTDVQASQGAAPVEGPGSGAGGQGEGFGSGNSGDGAGTGDGRDTPPRRIGGRIKPGDLPDDLVFLLRSDQDYTVGVKYAVEEDGHVTDCRITRSSGNRALDTLTCQLIERKFRYRPALDEDGAAFRAWIVENHIWNFEDTNHNRR